MNKICMAVLLLLSLRAGAKTPVRIDLTQHTGYSEVKYQRYYNYRPVNGGSCMLVGLLTTALGAAEVAYLPKNSPQQSSGMGLVVGGAIMVAVGYIWYKIDGAAY